MRRTNFSGSSRFHGAPLRLSDLPLPLFDDLHRKVSQGSAIVPQAALAFLKVAIFG